MVTEASGSVFRSVLEEIISAVPAFSGRLSQDGRRPTVVEYSAVPRLAEAAHESDVPYRHLDLALSDSGSVAEQSVADIDDAEVGAIVMSDFADIGLQSVEPLMLMRRLAQRWDVPIVVVAANAGYRAAVMSLLSGQPDRTLQPSRSTFELQSGVSSALLASRLAESGILPYDRHGVERPSSTAEGMLSADFFRATSIGQYLAAVRPDLALEGAMSHFVWICGLISPAEPTVEDDRPRPFLTVVIRTQGLRAQAFREALLCLSAQTVDDFEVVVLSHQASLENQAAIDAAVAMAPADLAARTRILRIASGSRASLLNTGFSVGRGRYFAVLDDDDLVMAHWVQSFRDAERIAAGRVLRLQCAVQDAERVTVNGQSAVRARSALTAPYEREFSYSTHLHQNNTPFMSAAFPSELFHRFGLRFDETMTTTEDWDFLMRAVSVVGIEELPHFTAVYRRWPFEPTSSTAHKQQVWRLNQYSVDRKLDSRPVLLPVGETHVIRELVKARASGSQPSAATVSRSDVDRDVADLRRLLALLTSTSWRLTAPMRLVGRLLGRGRSISIKHLPSLPASAISDALSQVESSRSLRIGGSLGIATRRR